MSKFRLKLLLWTVLIFISVAGCFIAVGQVANLLLFFQDGADPALALNIVPNRPADLQVQLEWLEDDPDTGREMEPYTRTQIESAYLRAWLQWNISYLRGEPYGLETYFVGPALDAVTEGVELAKLQGWSLEQTDLEHNLKLHMYSADGSIISMTAHNVKLAQILRNFNNEPIMTDVVEADYDVVMKLEDGNWRVRHWVRREKTDSIAETNPNIDLTPFAKVEGQQLLVDGEPYTIRGVNYYPKDSPWHDFWPEYDPEIIEQDFDTIADLGLNTIRIFIPYEPKLPEPDTPELDASSSGDAEYINNFGQINPYEDLRLKLNDLLQRAEDHDLKVIVTLFDFRTDYQILLWPNADRDMEEVVPYFADNPTILAWDLKNEPDLDQPGNTIITVNTWLTHIAQQVRDNDPNHLVTIGWSSSEAATQLTDLVDIVSFHDYKPQDTLPERIGDLRTAVPNKPIILTEFGLPTWNSRLFPNGHTEREQAVYYADVRKVLNEANITGYLAWTLYDFDEVPASVAGRKPWNTGPQRHLGLLDGNGEKKWAAFLLAENSNLDVPPLPKFLRFFKPFWQTVFMFITGIGFFTYNRVYSPGRERLLQKRFTGWFADDSQPVEEPGLQELTASMVQTISEPSLAVLEENLLQVEEPIRPTNGQPILDENTSYELDEPIAQTATDDSFEMSEEMKKPLKVRLRNWLVNRKRSRAENAPPEQNELPLQSSAADSVEIPKEMKTSLKVRLRNWRTNRKRLRSDKASHAHKEPQTQTTTADNVEIPKAKKNRLKARLRNWLIDRLSSEEEITEQVTPQEIQPATETDQPLIQQAAQLLQTNPADVPVNTQPTLEEASSDVHAEQTTQASISQEERVPLGNEGPSQSRLINWLIERQQSLEDFESDAEALQAAKTALENNGLLPQQENNQIEDNPAPAPINVQPLLPEATFEAQGQQPVQTANSENENGDLYQNPVKATPVNSLRLLEEIASGEYSQPFQATLGNGNGNGNGNGSNSENPEPLEDRLINWLISQKQMQEDSASDNQNLQIQKPAISDEVRSADKANGLSESISTFKSVNEQSVTEEIPLEHRQPTAKTALDNIHRLLGAQMQCSNGWWRPSNYGDVEKEYWAVRKTVSIMDVSTLGKITVAGPDALTFLEHVYPTKVSTIREGRTRYVLLLNEHGGIMDDGLIGKVRDAEYQLTLASNDIGKSEKWLRDWASHWQMDVRLINQTYTLGAINVTGPLASTLLERVGWTDAAAVKSMRFTNVTIAGVPCQVYRLSFTGEASFVLHHPAERSAELWNTLMNHGSDLGIQPHGLEALALLRLEKGDVTIEHDTDSETTPHHINRDWMCKLEKEFFIGKEALARSNQAGLDKVLVGFEIEGGHCQAGANIMKGGELAGYITSAAWSFALNKGIALGWLKVIGGKLPETVTINGMSAKRVDGPFQLKEAAHVRTESF